MSARPPGPGVGRFAARTLVALPVAFAAWYWLAGYHAGVAGTLARALIEAIRPGLVSGVERTGFVLAFVTTLEVEPAAGQLGVLVPEVSALLYTHGVALFLALMVAARARPWQFAAGAAALLPFQAWGIAFDFLAQAAELSGTAGSRHAAFPAWGREAITLGYQFGTLILPTLAPVVAWALFNRRFLEDALPHSRAGIPAKPI
jgi:hypothetical protein